MLLFKINAHLEPQKMAAQMENTGNNIIQMFRSNEAKNMNSDFKVPIDIKR